MSKIINIPAILNANGFSHVTTALYAAEVPESNFGLLTAADLVSVGISDADAALAIAVSTDVAYYQTFDGELEGFLATGQQTKAALQRISSLRAPTTPHGLEALRKIVTFRANALSNPALIDALYDALDRATSIGTNEGWPLAALQVSQLTVTAHRSKRSEELTTRQELQRVAAAKGKRRNQTILAFGGVSVALCTGGPWVMNEISLRKPAALQIDTDKLVANELTTYALPETGTILNGKGAVVETNVPVSYMVGSSSPEAACVVSGTTLTITQENPDPSKPSECTLTYAPELASPYAEGTCGTYASGDLVCWKSLSLPYKMVKDFKVTIDLPESREGRTAAQKGNCFLTTAACEARSLPDDCHALTALRRFRDEIMLQRPDWAQDVATYYAIAPSIVTAIHRRRDAPVIWADVFDHHIVPAVRAIDSGNYEEAYARYSRLVRLMVRKAGVA